MDTLLTILRAAHCRSTHHFLAIDGLRHVQTDRGRELRELALRHYDRYLTGSKDPDQRFRDFHNHVVHVEDGYWGGADESAELWRKRMLESLGQKAWGDAAYALGC